MVGGIVTHAEAMHSAHLIDALLATRTLLRVSSSLYRPFFTPNDSWHKAAGSMQHCVYCRLPRVGDGERLMSRWLLHPYSLMDQHSRLRPVLD